MPDNMETERFENNNSQPNFSPDLSETDGSPTFDDSMDDTIQDLLDSLSSRGKGSYTCPYGHRCKKGGVLNDSTVTIFERNSQFR